MFEAESHSRVRRLNPALVAVFAVAGLMIVPAALPAQVNGIPASVTSPGFGGNSNPAPGVRPSVTSLGRDGFNGTPAFPNCCINPLFPLNPNPSRSGRNRRRDHDFRGAGGAVYAVPYPVVVDPEADTSADEEEYRGGPTIFDRRGPGTPVRSSDPYVARADAVSADRTYAPAPAAPVEDEPQTTLVFKDGQRLDVENYAIVGSTLYDLTPGHRRKVALAELDLAATAKENDERGINFQFPPSLSMNSTN